MGKKRLADRWLLAIIPAAVVLVLVFFIPIAYLTGNSFYANAGYGQVGDEFTFVNYAKFFGDIFYWGILLKTLLLGAIVVAFCLLLGFPVAYVIARMRGRKRGFLIFLIFAPLLVSLVIRNLGWFPILGANGMINWALVSLGIVDAPLRLTNNFTGVVFGLVHAFLPIMILSLIVVIQRIELEIEEAAASLGAPPIERFWRVILPLSRSGMLAGGLLVFTMAVSAYTTPAMLGGNSVLVMSTFIGMQVMSVLDYAFGSTAAVILIVVASILAILSLKSEPRTREL